jgi:ABC-2 type transport system ATP-binding protein
LTKRYGPTLALDSLELTVAAGEVVCLLGANGAGKTTTINLCLGFTTPSAGSVRVLGRDVGADVAAARRALGYVAENVSLYPALSGAENIAFFAALAGQAADDERRDETMERLRFPKSAIHLRAGTYSKGMRQKLGLGVALMKSASGILLDEPLSGLDPSAANDLLGVLRETAETGAALLISTHDIFRARDLADRIGIMRQGRLVDMVQPSGLTGAQLEALYLDHMAERAA